MIAREILKKSRTKRPLAWGAAVGLVAAILWLWPSRLPSYQGKTVREWFEQASILGQQYQDSECQKAFKALEGDAIPYLLRWVDAKPSRFDTVYASVYGVIPASAQTRLPRPRDIWYYRHRSQEAWRLLSDIASAQRQQEYRGRPSTKPSISLALPKLVAFLQTTNNYERGWAAETAQHMGPLAAPAIPGLIQMARNDHVPSAIQALGAMAKLATNAAPVLLTIARDTNLDVESRLLAAQSLGLVGKLSQAEVDTLTPLQGGKEARLVPMTLRMLVYLGHTPESALPFVYDLHRQQTNQWLAALATLALWNHDRNDPLLLAEVKEALRQPQPTWLLWTLGWMGTNAAPFAQDVELLTRDPDPYVSDFAKRALADIQQLTP